MQLLALWAIDTLSIWRVRAANDVRSIPVSVIEA
jgi:hypothetical protein